MNEYAYIVNVEGAVIRGEEYLVIKRAPSEEHASGVLAFPGGKIEETPGTDSPIEATIRRELAEEVGLSVGTVEYHTSRVFETETGDQCVNIITKCEYTGGEAEPKAPTEVAAVHWLTENEIMEHAAAPAFFEQDVRSIEAARR